MPMKTSMSAVNAEPAVGTRKPTGIPGLDDILSGGLTADRLYLVDGDPGAGKTTLALQFLLSGVSRGERALYITLSETKEELDAVARSHGWSLDGINVVELVASEEELAGDAQLTMYNPPEIELQETTKLMLSAVDETQPHRVVIDALSELRMLSGSSQKYRRQIMALKRFFAGRSSTVLLLDDRTTQENDRQLQSVVHGVISLEYLSPAYGPARRRLRVVKFRGTSFREGFHDFRIMRGGLAVYPRLIAAEHRERFAPSHLKSGVSALDQLLGGGPDRGTSTLLIGPAGSGKSTLAVQYAVAAAARGDHAVIYSFDESVATLEIRTEAMGIKFRQGVQKGQVKVQQIDPAELSPGHFSHLVRESVERHHAKVVVIDTLNGYLNAMPEDRLLTTHLHELLSYLGRQGVTTILVAAQHGLLGAHMQSSFDTSYLADSVILLRFFEAGGRVKKAISVVKKRSGPHEDAIRELRFDANGVHLSEPLTQFQGVLSGVPQLTNGGKENWGEPVTHDSKR